MYFEHFLSIMTPRTSERWFPRFKKRCKKDAPKQGPWTDRYYSLKRVYGPLFLDPEKSMFQNTSAYGHVSTPLWSLGSLNYKIEPNKQIIQICQSGFNCAYGRKRRFAQKCDLVNVWSSICGACTGLVGIGGAFFFVVVYPLPTYLYIWTWFNVFFQRLQLSILFFYRSNSAGTNI